MKRKTKFFTALSILIISITTSQASTRSEVQYLVKKYNLSDAKIAIATQRTINGNQLYAYAQNRAMKPASNNKVFTIVAALFAIPSDFRFTTSIMYPSDRVKDHTLYGDLYIKFTGNPALTGSELATLIKK